MRNLFSAKSILEQIERNEKCFIVNQDVSITEEIKKIIEDEDWDKLKQEQQYRGDSEEIIDALRKDVSQSEKMRIELEDLLAQSETRLKECEMRLLRNEEARVGLEALLIQYEEALSGQRFFKTNEVEIMRNDKALLEINKKLEIFIDDMRNLKDNHACKSIAPSRKHFNRLIIFFKRIMRKLIRWYVEPMTERQTLFNNAAVSYMHEISSLNVLLIKRIEELGCLSDQNKQEIKKNKDIFAQSIRRIRKENINSLEIFINELSGE
jgi:hypothetical protein